MAEAQEMLRIAQEITAKKEPEEVLYITLMSYLEQRMAKCRDEINDFEAKYSMSFDEFEAKLGKELELSWEHEKDFFFWEGAKTDLKKLEEYKEKVELYGNRSFRHGSRAEYGSISLAEED